MSMNKIGKGLVLVHTALSVLGLSWAAGLFLQFIDLGWKEPRKEFDNSRIASKYDVSRAAEVQAIKARDLVIFKVKPAQDALLAAMERFSGNHLFYVEELSRLRSSPDAIEVKALKYNDGLVLDTPGKAIGKPVLEEKVEGISKSFESYSAELKKINEDIDKVSKDVRKWTEATKDITFQLTGKDDAGKVVARGLYSLLEEEKLAQDQALFEKEYLQPIWARAREEATLFMDRRIRLEQTLESFKPQKKK